MSLPRVLRRFTQVFLTTPCPLCQRLATALLCDGCYRQILTCQWTGPQQDRLGLRVASPSTSTKGAALSVFSWGKYTGTLKQSLSLLKYGNQAELGVWLGCQLGQQWRAHGRCDRKTVVVPIPLYRQRLRQRGYNQAALIAQGFCRITRLPIAEHGLTRIKATEAMHSLGRHERQTNLAGAFQLGKGLMPPSRSAVLLVDDIYTTGSTCNAAAIPLIQAGYSIMGIATVAQAVLSSLPDG